MSRQPDVPRPFKPQPALAAQLAVNRAGRLSRMQRNSMIIAALVSSGGLLCVATMVLQVVVAVAAGITLGGVGSLLFFVFFLLSFGFIGLTAYFNARWYIPDAWRGGVETARGPLRIKLSDRERPEMPLSYIVDDYSFAPYVVPPEIPLDRGREYIVYYAARSRMFLGIEPVHYGDVYPSDGDVTDDAPYHAEDAEGTQRDA